MDQINRNYT